MRHSNQPFAAYEWMIAWRYLRARRAEGGVSVMTWISLIGITLAVFALIATLAVRSGFRSEIVDTILGANAHVSVFKFRQLMILAVWTGPSIIMPTWRKPLARLKGSTALRR